MPYFRIFWRTQDPMFTTLPPSVVAVFKAAVPKALVALQKQRLEEAKRVLARRMSRGKPWLITQDETAAAIWTFLRAAQEGVARRNLDMIAEALVNSAEEGSFYPDEFRRQSGMLADLSREEIYVLAAFIRNRHPEQLEASGDSDGDRKSNEWGDVCKDLLSQSAMFKSGHDVIAHTAGLLRTGLVIPWSGFGAYTGFSATPRLDSLARLVDFEAATQADSDNGPEADVASAVECPKAAAN